MRRGDYKRIKQHVGLIKKIHFFLLLWSFDATTDKLSFAYSGRRFECYCRHSKGDSGSWEESYGGEPKPVSHIWCFWKASIKHFWCGNKTAVLRLIMKKKLPLRGIRLYICQFSVANYKRTDREIECRWKTQNTNPFSIAFGCKARSPPVFRWNPNC